MSTWGHVVLGDHQCAQYMHYQNSSQKWNHLNVRAQFGSLVQWLFVDCDCVCYTRRTPEWAKQMKVNHEQPFYSVLPDEHDCIRLFQGARISKYVAEVRGFTHLACF